MLTLGLPDIDEALPGTGLIVAALHEFSGAGLDTEFGAVPAQLIASPASRRPGPVLWVVDRSPPFTTGLAACGLCPDRIIFADAGKAVLGVMEDGLRHGGLAAVVGKVSGRFNPRTGEPVKVKAGKTVRFKASPSLKRPYDHGYYHPTDAALHLLCMRHPCRLWLYHPNGRHLDMPRSQERRR